eukprot:5759168-Amphidinium_carterae.1
MEYVTIDLDALSDDDECGTCVSQLTKLRGFEGAVVGTLPPRQRTSGHSRTRDGCFSPPRPSISQTASDSSGGSHASKQVTFGSVEVEYIEGSAEHVRQKVDAA